MNLTYQYFVLLDSSIWIVLLPKCQNCLISVFSRTLLAYISIDTMDNCELVEVIWDEL